jgi:hypothetical protein
MKRNAPREAPEKNRSFGNQRGVSLLELAIFLPVILVLVAGIIEYGSALRQVQAVASATREGARAAATHARIHGVRPCNGHSPSDSQGVCVAGPGGTFEISNTDPVSIAARKAACSFIANSGLRGTDWNVSARVPSAAESTEDGTEFYTVIVDAERAPDAKTCLLCWQSILSAFQQKAESTFVLESKCDR